VSSLKSIAFNLTAAILPPESLLKIFLPKETCPQPAVSFSLPIHDADLIPGQAPDRFARNHKAKRKRGRGMLK